MRLDPAPRDAAPEQFAAVEKKFGSVPNIFGVMGHHPGVLRAILQLNAAVGEELPARYRELAYLRSSAINTCDYCLGHHRRGGAGAGLTEAQIAAAEGEGDADAAGLDDKDRAVLAFAEQLTRDSTLDDATSAAVAEFLNPAQRVALAGTVGLANFTNRFNHAFDIETD